jgi:hypothetical protein
MSVHVLGIRHHGPGCARSLRTALDELRPDVIVMEGPADAQDALGLAGHEAMKPPVALLVYPPDEPRRGVYFPLAVFSPEWQTLRWAQQHHVPVRLMDLPLSIQFAKQKGELEQLEAELRKPLPDAELENGADTLRWRTDPLAVLAEAAGYQDHELWWEEQIERRENAAGLFEAIREAMTAVRLEYPEANERDLLREAHMRQTVRAVQKEQFERIAVVCGAWHAPVLDHDSVAGQREGCTAKDDAARLKGLPKTKTVATWIPWTHSRLTYRSGYGAGVHSPGWYAHVWQVRDQAPLHWVASAARLLRAADLDASSASVIETIRLADALAALRELRSPGLTELNEAILTVLCHGQPSPLRLIRTRLEVGEVLGETPADAPSVPLARDLEQLQKILRLKPSSENKTLDLDLRKENDRGRSQLLHQLTILNIAWGEWQRKDSKTSTFHEIWKLAWTPELAVEVIEASIWGNTVVLAATNKAIDAAQNSNNLPDLAALLDRVLLASLPTAVAPLLGKLHNLSAVSADVRQLMEAMPALARVARYGDVRGTQATDLTPIIQGMFERAVVGLPAACSSLDEEAARQMADSLAAVQQALDLLQRDDLQGEWHQLLGRLMHKDIHGLLRGWACRLLLDKGQLGDDEFHRVTRLALSPANEPQVSAAWATGLLRGSGMVLLHQDELWRVFDQWLRELPDATFQEMVPLLRRAFADFSGPERRQMGDKVKRLGGEHTPTRRHTSTAPDINRDRAALVLPVLARILGVEYRPPEAPEPRA